MSVKQKYLKDENGEIFSPITSANSVMLGGGELLKIPFRKKFMKKNLQNQLHH